MDLKDFLKDKLNQLGAEWSEDERKLAFDVAADVANLTTLKLAGKDVDFELKEAGAAAQNLAVAGGISAANVLSSSVLEYVGRAVKLLLPV